MKTTLTIIQTVIAITTTLLIVIQTKGGGLMDGVGAKSSYHSKKGVEKAVFLATIGAAALFVIVSLINALLIS